MTDIHTHILPQMDDGSQSVEESLAMLRASAAQGITCVAATPHFYPAQESPESFLTRRASAAARLRAALCPGMPEVLLGAEVCCFEGMGRSRVLEKLRIEGTSLLLIEMPFAPWPDRLIRELRYLQEGDEITVVLAHVERYLSLQKSGVWDTLMADGVRFQCNASFLLRWQTRRQALQMLRSGRVHLLGSDCHSMERRPPRLGPALARLGARDRQKLEVETVRLMARGE